MRNYHLHPVTRPPRLRRASRPPTEAGRWAAEKAMRTFCYLIGSFLLCSCVQEASYSRPDPADFPPAIISNAAQCADLGGSWIRAGMIGTELCSVPTKDAGSSCKDNVECISVCVAPKGAKPGTRVTGTCYGSTNTLGTCLASVNEGKAQRALCVD